MKEEIEEILDKLYLDFEKAGLTAPEYSDLRDYITNLYKENETLRKNQRYYKNGVFSLEYDKETMSDIIDKYKSRNEKAIEYIKENDDFYYGDELYDGYQEIINILKGGDDDENIN